MPDGPLPVPDLLGPNSAVPCCRGPRHAAIVVMPKPTAAVRPGLPQPDRPARVVIPRPEGCPRVMARPVPATAAASISRPVSANARPPYGEFPQ